MPIGEEDMSQKITDKNQFCTKQIYETSVRHKASEENM